MRSQPVILALLFASSFAPALCFAARGEAFAIEDCAGHEDEGGPCDECPLDCNAGCACCAHVIALPAISAQIAVVLVARPMDYEHRIERAPLPPEPRDRDLVPRA